MHRVEIPLVHEGLPAVCVVTGEVADIRWYEHTFAWSPAWSRLTGIVSGFGVPNPMRRTAKVALPFSPRGRRICLRAAGLRLVGPIALCLAPFVTFGALALGADSAAWALAGLLLSSPVVVWALGIRGRRPLCARITATTITLALPSDAAAAMISSHLAARGEAEAG